MSANRDHDSHGINNGNRGASSTVIQHFEQNFELSGFGSPGEALVTVKELVDNAIDACRYRESEQDPPAVRVTLTKSPVGAMRSKHERGDELGGPLELRVVDNGAGLTDITKALVLFSSTKLDNALPAAGSSARELAGKYGLGLTLSLLYSQKAFGGFLRVATATLDSPEWSFTHCSIDLKTGLPCAVYRKRGLKPESWAGGCGTDMRLLVPGDDGALEYAEPRLKTLFARLHLATDRAAGVTLLCEGCLGGMNFSVPRGGKEASPRLLLDNEDLVRAFSAGFTAMAQGANGFSSDSSQNSPRYFPGEDVAVFECKGKHGSRVTAAVAVERPARKYTAIEVPITHEISTSWCRHIRADWGIFEVDLDCFTLPGGENTASLYVHRITNGVPMLDTNSSSTCALVAGVSGAGWRNLGLKVSASRISQREGRVRFILSEAPTPLKVKGGAVWSALADIKAVHVAVAVNAEMIPYTSLRKDAIAQREGNVAATTNAIREGLLSLSNRETGGFRSAAEAAREMMQEDLIPLMASIIASVVKTSGDLSFQKDCLEVLGVGSEFAQQDRLTDFLESEVREVIREKEERNAAAKARAAARKEEMIQELARKVNMRKKSTEAA